MQIHPCQKKRLKNEFLVVFYLAVYQFFSNGTVRVVIGRIKN